MATNKLINLFDIMKKLFNKDKKIWKNNVKIPYRHIFSEFKNIFPKEIPECDEYGKIINDRNEINALLSQIENLEKYDKSNFKNRIEKIDNIINEKTKNIIEKYSKTINNNGLPNKQDYNQLYIFISKMLIPVYFEWKNNYMEHQENIDSINKLTDGYINFNTSITFEQYYEGFKKLYRENKFDNFYEIAKKLQEIKKGIKNKSIFSSFSS